MITFNIVERTVIRYRPKGDHHVLQQARVATSGVRWPVDCSGPLCRNVKTELGQNQIQNGDAAERADRHLFGGG